MTFDELARLPDDAIDLALGAALIAKDVYDTLDVPAVVARVRALAGPLALAGEPPRRQAEEVSRRFRDLGFHGNVEDYYDARNSLLPDVLDRRVGIPISLTLVWCEIARRAGVEARGVGFPGHFLARIENGAEPVIVDPFAGGHLLGETEALALLRRTLGEGAQLHPMLFLAATPRATLVRMLMNLKSIWAQRGDHTRAFVAIDRIVTLVPTSGKMLRERAAIGLRLGLADLAQADFARVVELEPDAPDAPQLRKRVAELGASRRDRPAPS